MSMLAFDAALYGGNWPSENVTLDSAKKKKAIYKKARDGLKEIAKTLQAEMHDKHPEPNITRLIDHYDTEISGLNVLIRRIETIGK